MEENKKNVKEYVDIETYYEGKELRTKLDYGMKRCKHCKEVKHYTKFPKASSSCRFQYGVQTVCFECREKIKVEKAIKRAEERKKKIQESIDMPTKKCVGCGMVYDKSEFIGNKNNVDGLNSRCSACRAEDRQKQYDKMTTKQRHRKYEVQLRNHKARSESDWEYRFINIMRHRIRYAITSAKTPRIELEKVLGCTVPKLRSYLGEYDSKTHHIDHIIPLSRFSYQDDRVHKVAFNYRNTQVIDGSANTKKYNFLVDNWKELLEEICDAIGEDVNFILENMNTD